MDKTRPEHRASAAATGQPHLALLLVLCGERVSLGGMAFDLDGVKEVSLGRGGPVGAATRGDGKARIDVPDPTMSGEHARLVVLSDATALLEDLGSRNGTRLLSREVKRAVVREGEWFVLGRSVFVLRRVAGPVEPSPFLPRPGSPLATFVPTLAETFRQLAVIAPSLVPVLLVGETGAGKDVVAQEVHALSGRPGRLVAVNCAALPETLVESELFGYRKGAFSDAREDRIGLVRSADRGTLLLDEIGDLPLPSQAKLLRVLQGGEVLALGSATPVRVDLRVVAATQRSLDELVRQGRFRADLLGRLAGFTCSLPPLRERMEDLGLLVAAILERHGSEAAGGYRFTADACDALLARRWPLNVRELERVLQAAMELARPSREIDVAHLGAEPKLAAAEALDPEALETELRRLLQLRSGNISAVARDMGKARMQIHRWMSQLGLRAEDFRGGSAPGGPDEPAS